MERKNSLRGKFLKKQEKVPGCEGILTVCTVSTAQCKLYSVHEVFYFNLKKYRSMKIILFAQEQKNNVKTEFFSFMGRNRWCEGAGKNRVDF